MVENTNINEKEINFFRDEYAFLSNFYECKVVFDDIEYQNSEAAFQAQKTFDEDIKKKFSTYTPKQSKYHGKRVALRSDWEEVKDEIMYKVVTCKFTQNEDLKEKLLATGDKTLIEGNAWNDRYWGVCKGKGQNKLGQILMRVREELK